METRRILIVLFTVMCLILFGTKVEAEPLGTAFSYQGRLIDANETMDGIYDFQFRLYDTNDPCDSNQMGSDVNKPDVAVNDGYFTVELDFGGGVFDGNARWLQIGVRHGEMKDPNICTFLQPRQKITSAPYATFAVNTSFVTGSTFTRWGNGTAPAGTSLVYSGYGFAGYYDHSGSSGQSIVYQGGDPGTVAFDTICSQLFPLNTHDENIPPGITGGRFVKAAVCYADVPTLVIWGTHTPPSGWSIIYRGYAMGTHYNWVQAIGPICVDCENFDSSHVKTTHSSVLVGSRVLMWESGAPFYSDMRAYIKCAVIKKN